MHHLLAALSLEPSASLEKGPTPHPTPPRGSVGLGPDGNKTAGIMHNDYQA